jgi:hypothetical protein
LQYCTIAVRREVYEHLGGFYGVTYGEDWEMWVRIAAHYDVAYTPDVLAEYRLHTNSISHQSYLSAKHIDDMRWAIKTIQKWIPDHLKKELQKEASKFYAEYAIDIANRIWGQTGNKKVTHKLMMETAKLYINREILYKMLKIYTKMLMNRR